MDHALLSTMHTQAAIWIDHKEARIFHFDVDKVNATTVQAPAETTHHKHPKGAEGAKDHPNDAKQFFHEVMQSVAGAEKILVVGPSTAKLELIRYAHQHDRALEAKIVGVETVDHPSDGQLVAYAKKYFKRVDPTH